MNSSGDGLNVTDTHLYVKSCSADLESDFFKMKSSYNSFGGEHIIKKIFNILSQYLLFKTKEGFSVDYHLNPQTTLSPAS